MNRPIIKIHRFTQDYNQTNGSCSVLVNNNLAFSCLSLERGWRNNDKGISCIPSGTYEVVLEYSPRFKKNLWEIKGVPNRSECKFHASNFWHQLNGCVALGLRRKDINGDGYPDVTASKQAMAQFNQSLKGFTKAILIIKTDVNVF